MKATRHAFTLVELLVVIAVLSILMSLSAGAAIAAKHYANRAKATVGIEHLRTAITTFRHDFGFNPPDHADQLPAWRMRADGQCQPDAGGAEVVIDPGDRAGDMEDYDNSNRILMHFLLTDNGTGGYYELKRKDSMQSGRLDNAYVFDCRTRDLYLFMDPWGSPYVYDRNWPEGDFDAVTHRRKGFDIYSFGPDGQTAVHHGFPEGDGDEPDDIAS